MKKRILAGLVCSMLATSVGFAAPQVDVPKGDMNAELTYTNTSNELSVDYNGKTHDAETFLKKNLYGKGDFDGHLTQGGITYGLKNGYALYVGYGEGSTDTLRFDLNSLVGSPEPSKILGVGVSGEFDILDLQIQKKLDKNLAAFIGAKEFKSAVNIELEPGTDPSKTIFYSSHSIPLENNTKRMLEVGLIGQTKLASKADVFAKVGFGNDLFEYKAGLNFKLAKNAGLELGYNYLRVKDIHNPIADAFFDAAQGHFSLPSYDYNADFTVKGFYYGLNVKF